MIFVHYSAGLFEAVWLDQTEGFCAWTIDLGNTADEMALASGLSALCIHLAMLTKPFALQIVIPCMTTWQRIQDNKASIRTTMLESPHASWYQMFPLSKSECKHHSLRHCFTHFRNHPVV